MQLTTATGQIRKLSAIETHTHLCKHNYAQLAMGNYHVFRGIYMLAVAGGILSDRLKGPIGH